MSNEYEVIAEGYLYNLWNGKLKEYRGEVLHKEKYEDSYGIYILVLKLIISWYMMNTIG